MHLIAWCLTILCFILMAVEFSLSIVLSSYCTCIVHRVNIHKPFLLLIARIISYIYIHLWKLCIYTSQFLILVFTLLQYYHWHSILYTFVLIFLLLYSWCVYKTVQSIKKNTGVHQSNFLFEKKCNKKAMNKEKILLWNMACTFLITW